MALSPAFLDELRARTPLAGVIGRRVKLARSGRQFKGCCPFHGEKTPSFYVYDDHFHCFGCGAHGDAVTFVMQSQGASFIEAVEQLAAEAGLDVPKPTQAAAEAERRRLDLYAVLEAAAAAFQRRLFLPEGGKALDYLRGRGLTEETIRKFGLGWSGEGRGALAADLARQEIPADMLVAAGLLSEPQEDRPVREMFFNRVMFPIRDRRGRVISFGGRILGDGQPKYLNGPETAVFSKRRTLFGLDAARQATRGGQRVVVVEGYMDVIALHQAGFTAAVAPLGTALTEEQLAELWRLSPAPVLCFDGDAAGGRAAARAADLALPLLTPEHTLSFAALPNGEDPDTLVRRGGAAAFRAALDSARPLIDALFHFIRDAAPDTSTPEQFESFKRRLDAAAGKIRDRGLAGEYRTALRDRLYEARRASRRGAPPARPIRLPRPVPAADGADAERCRILVAIVLRHPGLLHDVEEPFGHIDLPAWLSRLRAEILQWSQTAEALDSAALITHLTQAGLEAEVAQAISTVRAACAEPDAQLAEAEDGWWQFFGLLNRDGLEQEVEAARLEFERRSDPASERRLVSLRRAQLALFSCEQAFDIE